MFLQGMNLSTSISQMQNKHSYNQRVNSRCFTQELCFYMLEEEWLKDEGKKIMDSSLYPARTYLIPPPLKPHKSLHNVRLLQFHSDVCTSSSILLPTLKLYED